MLNSRMLPRVHSSYNTNPTPQGLLVAKLEVLLWLGASRCGQTLFQWPGEPSSLSTRGCAKGKVASNQAQMALPPQGQQERHPGCAKSKFSSRRNSQTKEFPMPIPKQKPFEMLTASPDIALTLCAPALDFI